MVPDTLMGELRRIVGADHVSRSRISSELYSYDASLAKGSPGAVVFPGDAHQTAQVIRAAAAAGVSIVPRGFGTNLSGGTVLPAGGLVVCLTRLKRILGINTRNRTAVVQPGVTNLELQTALSPLGFFYAPDPASQRVATLGGNVGENSGGPRCLRYGVTTNHVLGLEAVLTTGEILRLGGPDYDPLGYDLRGLLIGSEGTLATVTEIVVRILPKPEKIITQLAVYDTTDDAAQSVSDIIAAGILPATLEMIDAPIIRAVEDSYACGYPRDAAAVLIIEVEGPTAGLEQQAERIRGICRANRCRDIRVASSEQERGRLWEGRRGAFGAVARLAPNYLVNDCTVPRTLLPKALAQVADIVKRYGFEHGNVFHAGDGNLHPLILFDSRDADQLKRVHAAGWEIMRACVQLGGTISGEHGVGIEKREAMRLVFTDDEIEAQRSLQQVFDPLKVLNPGKMFPATPRPTAPTGDPAGTEDALTAIEHRIAREVREATGPLRPLGGGSLEDYGNLPSRPAGVLAASELNRMVELDPANQCLTAGAGMVLSDIQRLLAPHRQWLPIRPAYGLLRRTLGGIAATAACGTERITYGAPRRLLLGLRFIDGHGRLLNAGGRVMKNVAGYDLTRLVSGSAGTLGLITRATMKTAMRPERCARVSGCHSPGDCDRLAAQVLSSSLGATLAVATPDGDRWRLDVGFEGFGEAVASQLARTESLLGQAGFRSVLVEDYDLTHGPHAAGYERIGGCPFVLRVGVPADRAVAAAAVLEQQTRIEAIMVDFGCGRILAGGPHVNGAAWQEINRLIQEMNGHVLLEKAPREFKQGNDVYGPERPEWRLMHRIKDTLDPRHLFSPGRMPGRY
jgi:glycolate oxidase subunit GlcD